MADETSENAGSEDVEDTVRKPKPCEEHVDQQSILDEVPRPLRVGAAWSWRALAVTAVVAVLIWGVTKTASLIVPVLIALLLALLLFPLIGFLKNKLKFGNTLAAVVGLLTGLFIAGGLAGLAFTQLLSQGPKLVRETTEGLEQLLEWATEGPLGLDAALAQQYLQEAQSDIMSLLKSNSMNIASEALVLATSAVSVVAAGLLMLFTLFFFLKDGRQMWIWTVRMFPKRWRNQVNEAGIRGWVTLGWYVRTQTKVAAIDAVGIGLGAVFLGVPLAFPIAILVFFLGFIPFLGAFVSGAVAVLIALVNNGLNAAIIMVLVVLLVQQVESNVLQPWLMSQAVSLHPLAVVLVVLAGGAVGGIAGAIFSVPLAAFLNVTILYLHGHDSYPWLATDEDRPGGPPGSLEKQIAQSYGTDNKKEERRIERETGGRKRQRQAAKQKATQGESA